MNYTCPECSSPEITVSYITQVSATVGNDNILYIKPLNPSDATLDLITCSACGYEYNHCVFYDFVTEEESV